MTRHDFKIQIEEQYDDQWLRDVSEVAQRIEEA